MKTRLLLFAALATIVIAGCLTRPRPASLKEAAWQQTQAAVMEQVDGHQPVNITFQAFDSLFVSANYDSLYVVDMMVWIDGGGQPQREQAHAIMKYVGGAWYEDGSWKMRSCVLQ